MSEHAWQPAPETGNAEVDAALRTVDASEEQHPMEEVLRRLTAAHETLHAVLASSTRTE